MSRRSSPPTSPAPHPASSSAASGAPRRGTGTAAPSTGSCSPDSGSSCLAWSCPLSWQHRCGRPSAVRPRLARRTFARSVQPRHRMGARSVWPYGPTTRRRVGGASYVRSHVAQSYSSTVIPQESASASRCSWYRLISACNISSSSCVPLRRAHFRGRINGLGKVAVTEPPGVERRVGQIVGTVRVLFALQRALVPDQSRVLVRYLRATQGVQLDPCLDELPVHDLDEITLARLVRCTQGQIMAPAHFLDRCAY